MYIVWVIWPNYFLNTENYVLIYFNRGTENCGPAAGVVSTANDMGKWLQFVLLGGFTQDGESLVSNTSLAVSI